VLGEAARAERDVQREDVDERTGRSVARRRYERHRRNDEQRERRGAGEP
jgi:hypothetical protein